MSDKLKKFHKALEKKSTPFNIGFSPIRDWISTGNLALNAIISGSPGRGWPVSRLSFMSGLQGTGKSFLLANAIAQAQAKDYYCIVLDTENSLGDEFMSKIGVDLSPEKFMPVSVYSIEEVTDFVSEIFKNFEKDEKIALFIDSLSNLETERDMKKFEEGDVAYGQGLKEKLYKALCRNINSKIGQRDMMCIMNTHMYVNGSDSYGNPILVPACGKATLFIPSVGVELKKADLKEKKEQIGISISAKTYKTRYTSLGKKCEFDLPWDTGMNAYDGLLPFIEADGIIEKNGGWYSFPDPDTGEVIKFQKSNMHDYIDKIMSLYPSDTTEQEEDESHEEVLKNQ
jgi:RecA/RadA recombinase